MITIPELVVLALAGYRATQLAVYDTIGDPIRDRIHAWAARRPSRAREQVTTLIGCIYCTGWWVSGLVLAVYLTATGSWGQAPPLVHGIEWFAVAGAAVLAGRWDDHLDPAPHAAPHAHGGGVS